MHSYFKHEILELKKISRRYSNSANTLDIEEDLSMNSVLSTAKTSSDLPVHKLTSLSFFFFKISIFRVFDSASFEQNMAVLFEAQNGI